MNVICSAAQPHVLITISFRQSNMDWIFACGLSHFAGIADVVASYDIACQWFVNLRKQIEEWPAAKRLSNMLRMASLVPAFHFPAHVLLNYQEFDTRLFEGLGTLDLEAIERLWAAIGMLGLITRTMAPASRQLVLDNSFGFYNWLKYHNHGMN